MTSVRLKYPPSCRRCLKKNRLAAKSEHGAKVGRWCKVCYYFDERMTAVRLANCPCGHRAYEPEPTIVVD